MLTAEEAWRRLTDHREKYYRYSDAVYAGEKAQLQATGEPRSFWRRKGKCRIHVPIAADICSTASDLLFGEEPTIEVVDARENVVRAAQDRMEEIRRMNGFHATLCEAAESGAALGDCYLKCVWDADNATGPGIMLVQGDSGWPEYALGQLCAIHIFSVVDTEGGGRDVWRTHEVYEPGRITTELFRGSAETLGERQELGILLPDIEPVVELPGREMLAVHIPNMRPNRRFRGTMLGRSDIEGLRGLMDALDEAYSSWIRDIRLGKARQLIPAEYLRRTPEEIFGENPRGVPTFEFDEDVETLAAIDADPEKVGGGAITSVQFDIRAEEHHKTCQNLIVQIVQAAGYAPQTFGIDIQGMAQSGTALHIREKRSFSTTAKKQAYWKDALERLLTAVCHLDARLWPGAGSGADTHVHVRFADVLGTDLSEMSQAMQLLWQAQAVSAETRVQMLHPDWTAKQRAAEAARIREEYGVGKAQDVRDGAVPVTGEKDAGAKAGEGAAERLQSSSATS